MALKLGFIQGDVFDRHGTQAGLVLQHPIHQREGIPMGEEPNDLLTVEERFRGSGGSLSQGNSAGGQGSGNESGRQIGVQSMGAPIDQHLR